MRIAVDVRHLASPNPSGVGRYTIELLQRLPAAAPDIHFHLFAAGSSAALKHLPHFEGRNVTIQKHIGSNRFTSLRILGGKSLEEFVSSDIQGWWFPNANIIRTSLPYALTIHDVSFHLFPEFFSRKARAWHAACAIESLAKNAKAVLAVSQNTANDLHSFWGIGPEKIAVTPLGVSDLFSARQRPEDMSILKQLQMKKPYFLSLSTIEPRKNIQSAIEAFIRFKEKYRTNHRFIIAGGAGYQSRSILRGAQHPDIQVLGYIKDHHKPALYRHAAALVFASFYEGFGLPVAEALQSGTPVICSYNSSLPESSKGKALYINPYDLHDLETAFAQIESLPKPDPIVQSWDKATQKTADALRKLIY